jgi:hypothetical protein
MPAADRFISDNSIETVELAVVDIMGAIRGKRIPAPVFLQGTEFAMPSGVFCIDYGLDMLQTSEYSWASGYPDIFLVPDPDTLRLVHWRPGTALVFCDVVDRAGLSVPLDPRRILSVAQDQAREAGFDPRFGLETEFYLLDPDSLRPRQSRIPVYSLNDDSHLWPVIRDIHSALQAAGVTVEASGAEYGPGQVEINLAQAAPLAAADNLLFFRYAVKQIAAAHGYLATFMAKPRSESAGSGLHVHQSLRSLDTGRNVFWDGETTGLSAQGDGTSAVCCIMPPKHVTSQCRRPTGTSDRLTTRSRPHTSHGDSTIALPHCGRSCTATVGQGWSTGWRRLTRIPISSSRLSCGPAWLVWRSNWNHRPPPLPMPTRKTVPSHCREASPRPWPGCGTARSRVRHWAKT